MSEYVNFTLTYVNGTLPPMRTCTDSDPRMTVMVGSREAIQNEDAGCEGRYSSGYVSAGTFWNIIALGRTRARWKPVMAVVLGSMVSLSCVAYCIGAHTDVALARQLFLWLVFGSMTALICESRRAVAQQNFASINRILAMAQRTSDLLDTLIPSTVMQEASGLEAPISQSTGTSSELLDNLIPPAVMREDSVVALGTSSSLGLKLEKEFDHVLIMFCVLLPEFHGPSREAFSLLNAIFVEFDKEVVRTGMFKYHHINNTFVVASPAAALRPGTH